MTIASGLGIDLVTNTNPFFVQEHDPQQGLLPVESDTLFFPIFDEPRYPNQTLPSGIDIMDLFDSTMPVFPFFSNGE
jgi:hypothetical protein